MKRIDFIDSLRGWAILGVIAVHTLQVSGNINSNNIIITIAKNGGLGVWLFFIVSAFTIFMTLDKKRNLPKKKVVTDFFIKRILRIAPMYYLAIIYYTCLGLFFYNRIPVLDIITNIFFVHGFSPQTINNLVPGGWSITVEMTFYGIVPFILYKIKNLNQAFLFLNIAFIIRVSAIIITAKIIDENALNTEYISLFFPAQLPVFSMGIILYFIVIKQESIKDISKSSYILLSILSIISIFLPKNLFHQNYILFSYLFFGIAVLMSKKRILLLDNKFFQMVGRISYSLFIIHFIVIFWLVKFNLNILYHDSPTINFLLFFLLTVSISSAISYITYELIEKQFQNIGKKIILAQEKPIFNK